MPVAAKHRFDEQRLADYLLAQGIRFSQSLCIEQFRGGQSNPTFLLSDGDRAAYVLRKRPSGPLLPSAHAIDREFRVITALRDSEVPVAPPVFFCTDETVIGTTFYLTDYVRGRSFWDPELPGMRVSERRAIYDEMNRVIAALHRLDYTALGLGDYGKPGNYFARQIARWSKQYRASETERIESMEALLEWLPAHIPATDETVLVHGDFRLDNLIFHPDEPRILAVVDWELSTLGHPLADLAYNLMIWHLPAQDLRGLADYDLPALGIPTEGEYLEAYLRRSGRPDIPAHEWRFYLAFSLFRVACIRQGIRRRVIEGTASSEHAAAAGALAPRVADAAWRQVSRYSQPNV